MPQSQAASRKEGYGMSTIPHVPTRDKHGLSPAMDGCIADCLSEKLEQGRCPSLVGRQPHL